MTGRINRVTMFKIPEPANQKKLLEAYEALAKTQSKDGKPYILRLSAGVAHDDARSKGYTVVAQSEFASLEDMKFYDDGDVAHAALKRTAASLGLAEPPLMLYFTGEPQLAAAQEQADGRA